MEISSSRLTVIIPAYNGMPFLKDAVESILSQTSRNFHLLIIMDERRKNGESEISLAQWLELDKPLGVQQFQRYLDGTGQLFFRQAGSLIGEGKKLQGGLYLVGAFCCNPRFTTKRLLALRTLQVKHSTHGA